MLLFKLFNLLFKIGFFRIYRFFYFIYKSLFERTEIRLYKSLIQEGFNVVDAGANIGFYTRLFSKLVGENGLVIAYEPDPTNFALLEKNTSSLKNVRRFALALSDQNRELELFISKDLNVDHHSFDDGSGREKILIQAVSLEDHLQKQGISEVNFIKTDLQGYDPIALRGMKKLFQNSKKINISCEFWPYQLKKLGIDPSTWMKELESMGLQRISVSPEIDMNSVNPKYYDTIWLQN